MGFLDRVKKLFGAGSEEDDEEAGVGSPQEKGGAAGGAERPAGASSKNPAAAGALRRGREGARGRGDRPPLADPPPPSQSIEDALAAREGGDKKEARRILIDIDRGGGLRTILRAAAALEAGDESELNELLPAVAREEPRYKVLLQVAAALSDPEVARAYVERAERQGAPAWALAWSKAMSGEEAARREGLVELLFADHALARTVAARDLGLEGAAADPEAAARYAAFAHGRDSIRRFGAPLVAEVLDRARFVDDGAVSGPKPQRAGARSRGGP
jgi:hypothetical protein